MSKRRMNGKSDRGALRIFTLLLLAAFLCGFAAPAALAGNMEPQEPVEEIVEEIVEEPEEEVVEDEEPAEEIPEEPADEIPEEPADEIVDEEIVAEAIVEEEPVVELYAEAIEPTTEGEGEGEGGDDDGEDGGEGGELDPDANYIIVGKTFVGIKKDQIPENFYVTLNGNAQTYTLNLANALSSETSADGLSTTYRWRINNAGVGVYEVHEYNQLEGLDDYTLTSENAEGSVEVKAGIINVTYRDVIRSCANQDFNVKITGDTSEFFAAAMKQKIVVISFNELSAGQRASIEAGFENVSPGNWTTEHNTFVYYHLNNAEHKSSWEIEGQHVEYNWDTGVVHIGATSDWTQADGAVFSVSQAENPDLHITNTYTPKIVNVEVHKQVTGNLGDVTKPFSFTATSSKGFGINEEADYELSDDGKTATFQLKHNEYSTLWDIFYGSELTFAESDYAGYVVSATVNGEPLTAVEGKYTYTVPTENVPEKIVVVFTNDKNEIPDTGISLDSIPYILIIVGVVAVGAVMVIKKRRDAYDA